MKRTGFALLLTAALSLLAVAAAGAKHTATVINGAGSTFVSPLVSTWTPALGQRVRLHDPVRAVGSGGGIQAITNRSVDFGASDAPLTPDQFSACNGCVQIPWALAGTAIPYNIPGLVVPANTNLRLDGRRDREDLHGSDHELERPGDQGPEPEGHDPGPEDHAGLPHRELGHDLQLHRLPVGGQRELEVDSSAPARRSTGRRASARTAPPASPASSPRRPGAIGYVDTAFAVANHLRFASIKNAAGKFINPSIRNVAAAGGAVTKVPANNELHIVNPPKSLPTAYPIATYTYIILPTKSANAAALRKMVFWALTTGQQRSTRPSSGSCRSRRSCWSRPRRR